MNKTRHSATEFCRNKPMNFRPSGTLRIVADNNNLSVTYRYQLLKLCGLEKLRRTLDVSD